MSIVVQDLVKFYGKHKALDSISFTAEKGKILGFLGPNGAGKSTTMKIITGYLPSNSGKILVSGVNIEEDSLKARSLIGYLPENNPLYPDMYIQEFLGFIAEIYKVKNKNNSAQRVMEETGLMGMRNKKIGQLSKGYKQRVGLAQALIGNPEILILDEPTSGLDPNQLNEIRQLILSLGKEKTVLLSTHIMQEVQFLCDQVVILNKGKIVANDSVSSIMKDFSSRIEYLVEFNLEIDLDEIKRLENVLDVKLVGKSGDSFTYSILSSQEEEIREKLFDFAVKKNRILLGLKKTDTDLTEIFQSLTQS